MRTRVWSLSLLLALTSGCSQIGPSTIPGARFDYNEAISSSFDTQMLLNLVRLRYQDSILFLDLGSVVASYERSVSAAVSPSAGVLPTTGALGGVASGTWSETPTISYSPLQGEDFAKRLLAPIQPQAILLLSRSGWGLERLLLCTVQQMNDLSNGMAIGGVAPIKVRRFERFQRVAVLLRMLQEEGFVQLHSLPASEDGTEGKVVLGRGPFPMTPEAQGWAREVIALLGITREEGDSGPIPVDAATFPRSPASVVISGRSFLGVMTFLAQHIDVPEEHVRAGLVRVALGADGKPFDWSRVTRGLFRIHSGKDEPTRAYVRVRHRGYWFWIDDADVETKGTYELLCELFSLQAATDKIQAPVLTIPTR